MALNPAWFNTLVDDNGSNTIGTVWNKTQILNASNAQACTVSYRTDTGVVHDWAPGMAGHSIIEWAGSSDLTITGIAGGTLGQLVTIKNLGVGTLYLRHFDAGSAATTRLLNVVSSGATPLGRGGSATYVYGVNYRWDLVAHDQGGWISPPFNAANFAGDAGAWTVEAGDVTALKYVLSGTTLTVGMQLSNTSVAAGQVQLRIQAGAYGGFTIAAPIAAPIASLTENGSAQAGFFSLYPAYAFIICGKNNGVAFTATTNGTTVWGQLAVEVN